MNTTAITPIIMDHIIQCRQFRALRLPQRIETWRRHGLRAWAGQQDRKAKRATPTS